MGDEVQNTDGSEVSSVKTGFFAVKLIPVIILMIGFLSFFIFHFDTNFFQTIFEANYDLLTGWVLENRSTACFVYAVIYAIVTTFSIPAGAIMTILGGFLFGPWLGAFLTIIGATTGATLVFMAARYAFVDFLSNKAGRAMQKMENGFKENALSYLLFLRLIPIFPFWVVNLVPAFLNVRIGIYIVGTAIGIIPATVVYSMVGGGLSEFIESHADVKLGVIFEPRFLLPFVGLALLSLLPVLYKKYKGRLA